VRQVWVWIVCGCAVLMFPCGCENKLSVLKRAARLVERERYAEAVEAYERYIELVGDAPETAYERAEASYQIGCIYTYQLHKPVSGQRAFERAVRLRPDYADPQCHLGIMYRALGKLEESEAALRAALDSRPEITEYAIAPAVVRRPRVILADLARERGRFNEAIRHLYIYEHYSEDEAEDWHQLGRMFWVEHDYPKALFYFKRASETLTQSERGTSRYFPIRLGLIGASVLNGYLAEAQEILNESVNIIEQYQDYYSKLSSWQRSEAPGLEAFILESRRDLLVQQALVYAGQAQYEAQAATLRELRLLTPNDEGILLQLAMTYAKKGDFAAAREELETFRQLAPHEPGAIRAEAQILYEEGDYAACLARFEDYIAVSPGSNEPRALKAVALVKAGLADEGIAQLEALCRRYPNVFDLQVKMAQALAAAGRPGPALWWLRRATETGLMVPVLFQTDRELRAVLDEPGFAELLSSVHRRLIVRQRVHEAEDFLYRGEQDRGLAALDRLRRQNPDVLFTTYALARGFVFAGKPDEAFPLLMECARGGLFNRNVLARDGYLYELREDPRFVEVLGAIEQPWPTDGPGAAPVNEVE